MHGTSIQEDKEALLDVHYMENGNAHISIHSAIIECVPTREKNERITLSLFGKG
jgi:hypothetical protein